MSMGIRSIVAGLAVVAVMGVGAINSAWEYVQVGVRQTGKAIIDQLPVSTEIARLELLVENLNKELNGSRRFKAEATLAVEKAHVQVQSLKGKLDGQLKEMASIRQHLPGGCKASVDCSKSNLTELESALKSRLVRYERDKQSLVRLQEASKRLEASDSELSAKFEDRIRERDLLVQRLETIRTDKATLELMGGAAGDLPSSDTLERANKLAATLEDKLQVENAVIDMPIESQVVRTVITGETSVIDAAAEFDRLIGETKAELASK